MSSESHPSLPDHTVPGSTWISPNFITNSHGPEAPGPYQYTYRGAGPAGEGTHDARLEEPVQPAVGSAPGTYTASRSGS